MSKIGKTLFGGTDRSAQRGTQAQNEMSRGFIQEQMGQGRQDLQQGFGGAYNLLSGAMAPQLQAMQQGNVAAQQYLLGGMPAFQNAVMGMPAPMSQQQVFAPEYNTQMPSFEQMMPQQQPQQPQQPMQQMPPEQAPHPLAGRYGR